MATSGNQVITNLLWRECLDLFSVKKRASHKQPKNVIINSSRSKVLPFFS